MTTSDFAEGQPVTIEVRGAAQVREGAGTAGANRARPAGRRRRPGARALAGRLNRAALQPPLLFVVRF